MRAGTLAAAAAGLLLLPGFASAQSGGSVKSDPTGLHLRAYLNGSALQMEDADEPESGAGIGLGVGWGVSHTVTLYFTVAGANVQMVDLDDTYALAHADLGARVNFRGPEAQVLPWISLAVSGRAAEIDILGDPFTVTGAGPGFGAGVSIFLRRSTALDLGFTWTIGSFTRAEYRGMQEDIDLRATSGRFDVGLSWWGGR